MLTLDSVAAELYSENSHATYEPIFADEENSITTRLPPPLAAFNRNFTEPASPQTLRSSDLFRAHHLDDFSLHLKSAVLLKRVRMYLSRHTVAARKHVRPPVGYAVLNNGINDLLRTMPPPNPGEAISSDRLVAHANAHLALINLHEFFTDSDDARHNDYVRGRLQQGAQGMVFEVKEITACAYDLALLHSQTFICWAAAVVVLLKQLTAPALVPKPESASMLDDVEIILGALRQAGNTSRRAKRLADFCHMCRIGQLSPADLK